MLFNSLDYAVFLPAVCVVYYLLPHRLRWAALLAFSLYFYMSWNPRLILLILFTILVSWSAGLCLARLQRAAARRLVLGVGVGLCLAVLFFFKYYDFAAGSLRDLLGLAGLSLSLPTLRLMLPVGISFYTFQTLSYVIDVYRGDLPPERHLGYYALYVSFFPQLVAGPIERAGNLLPQFRQEHRFSTAACTRGLQQIGVGLFKKVVIADYLADFVDAVYNNLPGKAGLTLILATFLFGIQIYCDFSGYSDIAVGSARILGFTLMENFSSPYFARSIREFWRRWHISLTTWFTDYVYIPLGGSRCSRARHLRNLLITFLLSGLWHGASWTFVCWGLWHGLFLCFETLWGKRADALQQRLGHSGRGAALCVLRTLYTLAAAMTGWIFFRANSLADVGYIFANLFRGLNPLRLAEYAAPAGMGGAQLAAAALLIGALALWDGISRYRRPALSLLCEAKPAARYLFYWALGVSILLALMLRPFGAAADFIYFQF